LQPSADSAEAEVTLMTDLMLLYPETERSCRLPRTATFGTDL